MRRIPRARRRSRTGAPSSCNASTSKAAAPLRAAATALASLASLVGKRPLPSDGTPRPASASRPRIEQREAARRVKELGEGVAVREEHVGGARAGDDTRRVLADRVLEHLAAAVGGVGAARDHGAEIVAAAAHEPRHAVVVADGRARVAEVPEQTCPRKKVPRPKWSDQAAVGSRRPDFICFTPRTTWPPSF